MYRHFLCLLFRLLLPVPRLDDVDEHFGSAPKLLFVASVPEFIASNREMVKIFLIILLSCR